MPIFRKEECPLIVITAAAGQITVAGHAGCAPPGQDIVCAAVSALSETLAASLEALAPDRVSVAASDGYLQINYLEPGNRSEAARLLTGSFLLGVRAIAGSYPAAVRVHVEED